MNHSFDIYKNKKVLITGHTGFKGSWLSIWLKSLGANVVGVSKDIPTIPSNYNLFNLNKEINSNFFDILNYKKLKKIILDFKPDFIFHLAAQPLVMSSYNDPLETFKINTLGTLNLMNIIKDVNFNLTTILITSDKVYENIETNRGYKESDRLGGVDPYSASKSMTEIGISSYTNSFFNKKKNIKIGIARAGNVIGGGDWSSNRIIPDLMKSWNSNKILQVRNPQSTRPWQHVLEPLSGYLLFGKALYASKEFNGEAFNFGPKKNNIVTVESLIKTFSKHSNTLKWKSKINKSNFYYESKLLSLDCSKAKNLLNWEAKLNINLTVKLTYDWYNYFFNEQKTLPINFMLKQIDFYNNLK